MSFQISSSILEKRLIKHTRLITDPFPYIWIENFLPEDIYSRIVDELKKFDKTGKHNYEKNSPGLELYDPPETEVFLSLKSALKESPFSNAIFSYFHQLPFSKFDATYNRDFKVEYLGPHLDTNPQRLSLQIYLPSDDSQQDQGTIIGKKEDGVFKPVTQLKFLPNCAYAFLSGDETWHSIPTFDNPESKPRNSLMYRWK